MCRTMATVLVAMAVMASVSAATAAEGDVREYAFDDGRLPAGWQTTGDAGLDASMGREGSGGALRIGPGGKATINLRDLDASGSVDLWVYDDGTVPENAKTTRVGPRWGIQQADGNVVAIGILYASYLGGNEGYTATACDGQSWFNQLFWLGINRTPGWHRWTINFRPEEGIQVLHNGSALSDRRVDKTKLGLNGFRSLVIWGDSQVGETQTIWVDDVTAKLGGPVTSVPQPKPEAPIVRGESPWVPLEKDVPIYTKDNAPAAASLDSLKKVSSVSQYGITWTFAEPARVGKFINGDWYVVGPVTVVDIDPKPLYGDEIPEIELDSRDLDQQPQNRVRNGFMLNPPAETVVAYDSGVRNYFRPALIQKLPVEMKAGDSLVSTISMPKGLILPAQLRNDIQRGKGDSSPIRTAAVLTCVDAPQPADAFRPAFCDREQTVYYARNLRRDLLPEVERTPGMPDVELYVRFTQRPWVGTCFFGFEEPVENMPQYGLEYGRVAGMAALLLCVDIEPERREPLLVNYVQVGIDLGGMVRAGHPGWPGYGGHGSGRKIPIVFAGLMLGDETLASVSKSYPKVMFGENEQTAYGPCWTGAKVVFAGHSGIDTVTGAGRGRGHLWGPYEHLHPSEWVGDNMTSESYRRCCTSVGWVAQALAMRLLDAEDEWAHDAFFDYVDRWMHENDSEFVQVMKDETERDYGADWARQGQCWEAFANEMWAKYRPGMPEPTDSWKKQHDDSRYRRALELYKEAAGR